VRENKGISVNFFHTSETIQSMILASSMLQTRKDGYSEHFNFVIFFGYVAFVCILSLYAINMGVANLFTNLLFLVFSDFVFVLFDVFFFV
jgi:hypothetical protein